MTLSERGEKEKIPMQRGGRELSRSLSKKKRKEKGGKS